MTAQIGKEELATRFEHPLTLSQEPFLVREKVEHAIEDRSIEVLRLKGQGGGISTYPKESL